ncbi:MAG: PAS domain S-box protein [Balneolaceae bacterium]|nr:PAS domain S-box protein [Balneolaceae bacterium]MBO6547007.1 PAS domain S-box protein [Balneolaceae bacterium]MBO6649367.1 PAS domain S-box protein [Balneolaceae bacterium]
MSNNIETTKLVEITANIERGLYQTLIYLNAIKEADTNIDGQTTLDEPTVALLTKQFHHQLTEIDTSISLIREFVLNGDMIDVSETIEDLKRLEDRVLLYSSLSTDWLNLEMEDAEQADILFNTSISPHFRNRVIPVISHLREHTIEKQTQENATLTEKLEQATYGIAIVSIVCVLIAILIAFYVYRSIADPLIKLNESAKRLGQGDLDQQTEIKNKDEIGQLASSFNEMASNLKKRTLARDYLDSIIESIQETLIVTDDEGNIVGINQSGLEMLHYTKEEILGLPVKDFFDFSSMGSVYEKKSKNGNVFEFSLLTKRRRSIPVQFSESELINAHGKKVGSVCVATDISERKKADEELKKSLKEKEVLLSEIHHRVKNNLAVISGILQLQVYETSNEEVNRALTESQTRIQSMSLVHEMLYQSDTLAFIDYRTYVHDLMQAISSMYINESKEIVFKTDIDPISLDINHAIPCSLLLNEIIVNCYKHAFNDTEKGEIKVTMKEKEGIINLTIEDNGIGVEEERIENSSSLGSTLIKTLTSQLSGTLSVGKRENSMGTKTEVSFVNVREELNASG